MSSTIQTNKTKKWLRPWHVEKHDNISNYDDRFFAILIKGFLTWLNTNIVMYNKPIKHFILNTGNSYIFVENNGYEFNWAETTGEDMLYFETPRCVVSLQNISIPFEELTAPYSHGIYERRCEDNNIQGFYSTIRRMPIEWIINLKYILSNFNESIILIQEIIDKLTFQQYFNIVYLGQIIQCSFEIPSDFTVELNKIDMTSPEVNQKSIDISLKICANYPIIDENTEIPASQTINNTQSNLTAYTDEAVRKI